MAHAYLTCYHSEAFRVNSSEFEPATGTITLSSVAVTLRDAQGAIVEACDGVPATAFTSGASAEPYAQYQFSPAGLNLDEPTMETGQANYTLSFVGTSSTGQKITSVIGITLLPDGA